MFFMEPLHRQTLISNKTKSHWLQIQPHYELTMNVKELSAADILAIPATKFDKLFSADDFQLELKQLRRVWHPDFHGNSVESNRVFTHITELFEAAQLASTNGTWPGNASISWTTFGETSKFQMRYRRAYPIEVGVMYVSDKNVMFVLEAEHEKLFYNAVLRFSTFKYAGPEMEEQFACLLPKVVHSSKTSEGKFVLVLSKTEDVFLLRDVLELCENKLPSVHVAWITSRLHNLAAYFEYAGISHQALALDTLFISAKYHTVLALGGWWYSADLNATVSKVPGKLLPRYPRDLLKSKRATVKTDQALIRALGLELLGDATCTGTPLLGRPGVPAPMLRYLQCPPGSSAVKSFADWANVLQESFGERKFVEFPMSAADIYPT